jgi:hypothetical protein
MSTGFIIIGNVDGNASTATTAGSAGTAGSATNLSGTSQYSIPYQSSTTGETGYITNTTIADYVLTGTPNSAPSWQPAGSITDYVSTASSASTNQTIYTPLTIDSSNYPNLNFDTNAFGPDGPNRISLFSITTINPVAYGFGMESGALKYLSGGAHTFYTSSTPDADGTLIATIDASGITMSTGFIIIGNVNGNASTATNATNAGYADTAGSAGTATNATNAGYADTAGSAGSAGTATNATNAGYADTAGSAGTAGSATSAGTATNVSGSGTVTCTTINATTITCTSVTTSSDYRIKQNTQPLNDTYNVDNLRPVSYYNKLTEKQDIGLLAHELQDVYPFMVTGVKDGEQNQSVNYLALIGILIKEIQQLKARVNILETK